MKILVVEDDRETATYLTKGLSESGYTVDCASDGRQGLFLATSGSYDGMAFLCWGRCARPRSARRR
jgi:two-component system OmpR family response regulator